MVSTSQSGDLSGPAPHRASLRLSTSRQSLSGALGGPSQKRMGVSNTRVSSPGHLGVAAGGGGESPTTSVPGASGPYGETPRLPLVSESGDKPMPRPPPSVMLRRASTLNTMNVGPSKESPVAMSPKERDRERDRDSPLGGESAYTLKKERNALKMDKNLLLLNKRRLENLLSKLLENPLPGEEADLAAQQGQGSPVLRASSTRAQLMKALDESTGLEKQLLAGAGASATAFEAELARSIDVSSKMAEMQAEHEIAISRLEGELSYRRTQAAAATASLQKQLNEAQEELGRAKQQLAGAEAQVRELSQQNGELRKQVHNLNNNLSDKSKALAEARDMLGMEKSTLATIIEMLKEQLREASADRAAKNRLISELEYAIVHRDALLTEAHERMNQAAAQAAAAAAAGVSSSAAVARVAASMQSPLDPKNSWGMLTGRGMTRGGTRMPGQAPGPRVSGPGNGPLAGGGGGSGGGGGHGGGHGGVSLASMASIGRARGGAVDDEDTYSGEVFESADAMD